MESAHRVKEVWSTGSYADHARNYLSMTARLVETAGVGPDDRVLDVACGTGNVAITAARRGAAVTGLDITPAMLEDARRNAEIAGVDGIDWREGDATALPFDDDAFDATLSNLGHMFGDPPAAAARELARVTRPGGHVGFTAWTPTSLFPAMAGVLSTYLEPEDLPEFSEPPFMWGDADVVRDRMGETVTEFEFETATATYPALSPGHFWEEMTGSSGPFIELLAAVDDGDRSALREQMLETVGPFFDDGENAVALEYLHATARVA